MDFVNGMFELGGALLLLLNVRALYRHREIKGVHRGPTVFFTFWGMWNLFYYPHLGQWWSFAGGIAVVLVNLAWLLLIVDFYLTRLVASFMR